MQKQNSEKKSQSPKKEVEQEIDPDDMPDDDQCDLDLFKRSSLRQRTDPDLPVIVEECYNVKKDKNQDGQSIVNQYVIKEQLGKGAFGQVFKVVNENDKNVKAMKVYNIFALNKQRFFAPDGGFANGLDMLDNQLNIVKRLQHPNLPSFSQILHSSEKIYLIFEYCNLGQIMNWNSERLNYDRQNSIKNYIQKKYQVTELYDVTRIIFGQVCSSVKYLHDHDITNRDIKVDNILCNQTQNKLEQIKLTDFTTIRYSKDDISYFASGTPGFRGPQHQFASEQGYSSKASDIWSIGVSIYTYFYENFPFYGQSQLQIDIKAKDQALEFDETCPAWLKELIEKMTAKQWKDRITIDQALKILAQK